MKILKLTLNKQAFEITGSESKPFELRKQSRWILSRLRNKDGTWKKYDAVQFRNGYSPKSPLKTFEFRSAAILGRERRFEFGNGLIFDVEAGDVVIFLGPEIEA